MKPYSPSALVDLIHQNKAAAVDAKKVIQAGSTAISIVSKTISDHKGISTAPTQEDKLMLDRGVMEELSRNIQARRKNNKDITVLFPDIELCIQVMVSSILSPKKMTDINLNYSVKKTMTLPPSLMGELVKEISEYVTEEYAIEDKLSDIVREALFETGSYCMAVIPEASVDELINADIIANMSMESYQAKADKLLSEVTESGISFSFATEDYKNLPPKQKELMGMLLSPDIVRVTDNIKLLHFPEVKDRLTGSVIKAKYRQRSAYFATEAASKIEYLDVFRRRTVTQTGSNVAFIRNREEAKRKSVGKPMTVVFPSASVIPVGIPGNEKEHVAYLVLTDENGRPLDSLASPSQAAMDAAGIYTQSTVGSATPIQTAYRNLVSEDKPVNSEQLYSLYKTVLEKQLYDTVRNSLYGKNVKITEANDIYFMMFCRALAGQRTNILFVPKEMMVYFAFYHNDYGIGRSLMDNLTVLSSLRAIILFSKVVSESKSAIDVTKVNVQLDPRDPDYKKTIRMVQDAVLKGRQNDFPIGINNYNEIVHWLQRAGLQFNYSSVEGLPDTRVEFEAGNIQHNVGNTETEDNLGKQMIKAMGMPPELIDNAWGPEFATTAVNNNILLSKRVKIYQKVLTACLNKLTGLFIYTDENLRDKLRKVINEQIGEVESVLTEEEKSLFHKDKTGFIDSYLDKLSENMDVKLPEPENTNLINLSASYETYKSNLMIVIDSVVSTEIFGEDVSGKFSEHVESIKNIYLHHLLRQWCADNNYFPEALAFSSKNKEDIEQLSEVVTSHLSGGIRNGALLLRMMQAVKAAADKDLEMVSGDAAEEASDSGGSSSSSSSDESSGETGDDLGSGKGDSMSGDDMLNF